MKSLFIFAFLFLAYFGYGLSVDQKQTEEETGQADGRSDVIDELTTILKRLNADASQPDQQEPVNDTNAGQADAVADPELRENNAGAADEGPSTTGETAALFEDERALGQMSFGNLKSNVRIVFNGQQLNSGNRFKASLKSARMKGIENCLHGQPLSERALVWGRMANVDAMVDKAVTGKQRTVVFDVGKEDLFQGDIILTESQAGEIETETARQIASGELGRKLSKKNIVEKSNIPSESAGDDNNEKDAEESAGGESNNVDTLNNLPIDETEGQTDTRGLTPGGGTEATVDESQLSPSSDEENNVDPLENLSQRELERLNTYIEEIEAAHDPTPGHDRRRREAVVKRKMATTTKWQNPIKFSISSSFTSSQRKSIRDGIRHWESQTCLDFVETSSTTGPNMRFITTTNVNICGSSFVGRRSTENPIRLRCFSLGVIVHEIGHALGLWHEQSRPDRDAWVNILWDNIRYGSSNFNKKDWANVFTHGVPYDYYSVMHYSATAFAKPGKQTIIAKDGRMTNLLGQRKMLTFWDFKLVNAHYECSKKCTNKYPYCYNDGYKDPKNCKVCKCPEGWSGASCNQLRPASVCTSPYRNAATRLAYINYAGIPKYGVKCTWLITVPGYYRYHNRVLVARFLGSFSIRSSGRCVDDHVEVRDRDLSLTGPRYCGSTRPTHSFISTIGKIMVIFDARTSSDTRFSLYYYYYNKHCGGCNSSLMSQAPCYSNRKASCPARYTYRCGLWRRCTRYRQNTCFKTYKRCCTSDGYILRGNSCVFTGCGGCRNKRIRNQKPCSRRVSYRSAYRLPACTTACTRYRIAYRTQNYCCSGFRYSGGRCLKI